MELNEDTTSADAVANARDVLAEIRARVEETATLRRVPDANIDALRRSGALRTIQSTRNGGFGLSMRAHLDVVSTVAQACGSTGWVLGVAQAHSWLLSHFPAAAQDDVYANNHDAVVAAVIGPRGVATVTAEGYCLSGFWPFASGNENADWLLLGGAIHDENDQILDEGCFLVHSSQVERKDDWYVSGLTGSGSCSITATDQAVPSHRFLSMAALLAGTTPGIDLHEGWNQRWAPMPVLALALTGPALGIARQALDDFPGQMRSKTSVYEHPLTHMQVGHAAMLLREAELLLYGCADELDSAARDGSRLELETRARMRLDCATGVHRCLESVEILFHASGASGVRLSSPLTREVADLRTISQHDVLMLEANQELYGRVRMGLDASIEGL